MQSMTNGTRRTHGERILEALTKGPQRALELYAAIGYGCSEKGFRTALAGLVRLNAVISTRIRGSKSQICEYRLRRPGEFSGPGRERPYCVPTLASRMRDRAMAQAMERTKAFRECARSLTP